MRAKTLIFRVLFQLPHAIEIQPAIALSIGRGTLVGVLSYHLATEA